MRNFTKKAAAASEVLVVLWLVLQLSLGWFPRLWTKVFGTSMYNGIYILNTGYANVVPFYMAYALAVAAVVLTASNVMIFRGKGKRAPLIVSAVTIGLLPIVTELITQFQASSIQYSGVYYTYSANGVFKVSYVLYAAAVVSIAAGAVYACENFEKASRKAAAVSQIFLIVWFGLQLWASISKMRLFADYRYNIVSFMVITLCVGSLLFTVSNIMIFKKIGRRAPFFVSSITCGVMPIAVQIASRIQNDFLIAATGRYSLLLIEGAFFAPLSCILYVGAVLAIAAGAAYVFSKGEKSVPEESAEVYEFE